MAIEDDIALFARVPTLNLLGMAALQVLAIGAEQRDYGFGERLFEEGEAADSGYIVRHGAFRVASSDGTETVAGRDALIGELALMAPIKRPATATALEPSSVLRISRSLFLTLYIIYNVIQPITNISSQNIQVDPKTAISFWCMGI